MATINTYATSTDWADNSEAVVLPASGREAYGWTFSGNPYQVTVTNKQYTACTHTIVTTSADAAFTVSDYSADFDVSELGSNEYVIFAGGHFLGEFYGAGCQGKVDGTVSSTLTNCTVMGSVFGGGYKATNNTLLVYSNVKPTYSIYSPELGLFTDFGTVAPVTWEWEAGELDKFDATNKKLKTNVDLTTLGNVTDVITLTIDNVTVGGNVFGGGNESVSKSDIIVTLKGDTEVAGDVFGGGNEGHVEGSTTVNILE